MSDTATRGRRWLTLAGAFVAAGAVTLGGARPAQAAVDPATVVSAVQAAYGAYQKLSGGQLTLAAATNQIINAIGDAQEAIIDHVDQIAAADIEACATSAVINVDDLPAMTPDSKQAFAFATTDCVTRAKAFISTATSKVAIDHVGYALAAVGPISLLARKHAGLSTTALKTAVVGATNNLISRLTPSCTASPLWGDAEPGGPVEVLLRCTAFNGQVGGDSVILNIRRGDPLPPFNYTVAKNSAMRGTSYQLAVAALPILNQTA